MNSITVLAERRNVMLRTNVFAYYVELFTANCVVFRVVQHHILVTDGFDP